VPETTRLLAKLKDETERYYTKRVKIGTQHTATGFGLCDLDDRLTDKESSSWRSSTIKMDHFGIARVVVDILYEREEEEERRSRGSNAHIDAYRWHKWNLRFHSHSEEEIVKHLKADEDTVEPIDVD